MKTIIYDYEEIENLIIADLEKEYGEIDCFGSRFDLRMLGKNEPPSIGMTCQFYISEPKPKNKGKKK